MRVFDIHAHLRAEEASVAALLEAMDRCGIEVATVVGGGLVPPAELGRRVALNGSFRDETTRFDNLRLLELSKATNGRSERIRPFYFANPWRDAREYDERGHDFIGLKLAPVIHGFTFADPEVDELIRLADRLDHPVYAHCLAGPGLTVTDYVHLATRHPAVRFILGHGGIGPVDFAAVDAISGQPNIWLETSGTFSATTAYAVKTLGAKRVLFGSEFPLQDPAVELTKVMQLQLDESERVDILWNNAQRLLPDQARRTVERARLSPAYSEALSTWTGRWEDLPYTTKNDLRRSYPLGMLAVSHDEIASYHESSGTSGEPTATYFTENDWHDIVTRFLRSSVGLEASDWVLIKTPYALVTTAHQMQRAAQLRGATIVPADNRSLNMPYPKVVRLLRDLPISVVWALPTEVALWAKAAKALGHDPARDFPTLRALWVAGESLSEARRNKLSELWGGVAVVVDYGSTETGSLAGECHDGKLHLWTDRLKCEIDDGELIVTPLGREAMPLLRYRTGDVVEFVDGPCECGSSSSILRVRGRKDSALEIDGKTFFPVDLEQALFSLSSVAGDSLWRARPSAMGIEYEVDAPLDVAAAAAELSKLLGVSVTVRCVESVFPTSTLLAEQAFTKPKYVFKRDERWDRAVVYQ